MNEKKIQQNNNKIINNFYAISVPTKIISALTINRGLVVFGTLGTTYFDEVQTEEPRKKRSKNIELVDETEK